ncbi:alkylresorcinol/alkylpyrone synthase [Labrenzia sp. EL_142]|nr:alkylresorcinol/alkylpyrone synthase [Labrenzia sp. EL_142]
MVVLSGLGTAVPKTTLSQTCALAYAKRMMERDFSSFNSIERVFENAGIAKRHCACDEEWYDSPRSWEERNDIYLRVALELFESATLAALHDANWIAEDIDVIVTVSSTGIATPTLEARALSRLGFRENVVRVPVFGLGCAGGVSGLSIARDLAASTGRRVLLVAVETCTLQFKSHSFRKADIIATALFGDGAAAACLSGAVKDAETCLCTIRCGYQHTWPDTLSIMGWNTRDNGLEVVFDRSIPPFVLEHFSDVVDKATQVLGKRLNEFDSLVCHPGGTKVILAIETCLELAENTLDLERQTLNEFGNMSAPTVLFVLRKALDAQRKGSMLLASLGPGFTASFLPIEAH